MSMCGVRRGRAVRGGILAVMVLAAAPAGARAQASIAGEITVFGVNALLGAATAGLAAHVNDGAFLVGAGHGAVGGAAVYLGKRMNTADVTGASWAGRLIAAAGASAIRNSAAARPPLSRILVPVGPVTLYLSFRPDGTAVVPKLNLGRGVYLTHLLIDDGYRIDWPETLAAGAPIFRAPGRMLRSANGKELGGLEFLGTITLSDPGTAAYAGGESALLAHERVHVLQDDFISYTWAGPVEDWLLERVPGGGWVGRFIDTDLVYLGMVGLAVRALPYHQRPWEIEAGYFGAGW